MTGKPARRIVWALLMALAATALNEFARSAGGPGERLRADPRLEAGFAAMYGADFASAQKVFADYRQSYPSDPVGYAAESASILFSELNRLGLLDAQFYLDDSKTLPKPAAVPDPRQRQRLFDLTRHASQLAVAKLAKDSSDEQALFALMLANGILSDYSALIEHHYWAAAKFGGLGEDYARKLLAVDPQAYDAFVPIGAVQYILGTLPAPVRLLARLAGFSGSRQKGLEDLSLASRQGHLLKPYAKILLTVIYLHEKNRPAAAALVSELSQEFPTNPLFSAQAKRLQEDRR